MKKALLPFVLLVVFFSLSIYFPKHRFYNTTSDGPDVAAVLTADLAAETPSLTSPAGETRQADRISAKPSEQKAGQIESDSKATDRFAGATVLKTSETAPDKNGCYERKRLVRADFKYPLILLEESLQTDPQTGAEQLLRQNAMVADHVMVKVPSGVSGDQLNQTVSAYGGHIRKKMYAPDLYLVEFQNVDLDSVSQAVQNFSKASGSIAYAEPDYVVSINDTTPNDTDFNLLWGMHNTGQSSGTPDADIDAPAAWDVSTGSSNIVVAVIDTGIDYTHPDLAANMWRNPGEIPGNGIDDDGNGFIDDVYGRDFANDDSNPIDDQYHGTHCAGTIGGVGNNGAGVVGVNWTVRLMALKFLNSSGSGYTSDAVDATHYATIMKAKLTSNSWGGGGYDQALVDAIEEANRSNILFVAAAGNNGANTDVSAVYPSSYTNANLIAVAATDNRDQLASFSNYGLLGVDLGAPGVNVWSCKPSGLYQYLSGTSMATPHVAGACALLWSMNPKITAAAIKQAILDGTEPIAALSNKCVTGGRLNIYSALRKLDPNATLTPVVGVTFSGFSGGPFVPSSGTYTIINIGTNSFSWTADKTAMWLDLSPTSGCLSPDQSNAVIVSINTNANTLAVGTYTDTLTFSNTVSAGVQARTVSLTVQGEITFAPDSYTVGEAGGTALISVRRAGNTNRAVTVDFATSDGTATAGSDYVATNGTLAFATGDTVKNFTVPILNDSLSSEWRESVILTLSNPTGGGTLGSPSTASLRILDDDVTTRYVSLTGGNVAPYTNWAMAATSIQPAVNVSISGDVIRVAAGTYVLSSQISVPVGITVRGAGAGATIVDGNNAVGCFSLTGNAAVAEMTITRGHVEEDFNGTDAGGVAGGIVSNCTLSGNWASYGGGGADHSTLYNCTLSSNSAGVAGGGAWLSTLYNCIITGNSAAREAGGAYYCTLYNCLLSGNSATEYPSASGASGGSLYNCTLSGNHIGGTDSSKLYNCIIYPDSLKQPTIYNCWTNDPKFVDRVNSNFHLQASSPCIDAGNNSYVSTASDLDGNPRIINGTVDMGAYEYIVPDGYYTLTVNSGTGGGTYTNGQQVVISANAPAPGKAFSQWIGDIQYVNNITYTNALVTMSTNNVSLTATYADVYYTLTVNSGSGSGSYTNGQRVAISADAPLPGQLFDRWIGDTAYVASVNFASTTVTMPAMAIALTATYKSLDTHYVSLTGGNIAPYTNWATAATSIQPAVNAAVSGDVVRVAAGTYVLSSRISVPAGITIQGAGAGVTIVDGNNAVGCFSLAGNAGVAEMTITRGHVVEGFNGTDAGGVAGGIVSNCTLSGNWASYGGGGADHSTLYNCTLSSNSAGVAGGGAWLSTLYNCIITGNSARDQGGGAYYCTLYNCTLSGNSVSTWPATSESAGGTLYNSILYPNSQSGATLNNCWTNDPKFVDRVNRNFHLQASSPCIDAGNNSYVSTASDLDGNPRIINGTVDIGAYEYVLPTYYTLTVTGGSGSGSYTNQQRIAITADAPASGKTFDQWTGDTQYVASVTSPTTTVTMPAQAIALTATYKDAPYYTLTVTSAYGGSEPSGTNSYNTAVSVVVTNSPVMDDMTQYVCSGWTRTGSTPASGTNTNTGLFLMTNDTTVVWWWTTNYWLQVDTAGSGTIDTSSDWLAAGTNVQISATPDTYYHFTEWAGDTEGDPGSSPMTLVMSGPRWVMANFAPNVTTNTRTPEWWLAQYGLTNFNADVLTDIDLDGQKTWEEYIAGTDPTNRNSVLTVAGTFLPNGSLIVSWFGVQSRTYTIQYADLLMSPTNNWQTYPVEFPGLGTVIATTGSQIASNGFYRVKVRISE